MDVYIFINIFILCLAIFVAAYRRTDFALNFKKNVSNISDSKPGNTGTTNVIIYFILCFLLLLFFTVFRSPQNGLSTDYTRYLSASKFISAYGLSAIQNNSDIQIEKGLAVIMQVNAVMSKNTILPFIFITTAITLSCYFYRFRKDSPMVWLSIYTLITFGSYYVLFNGIAQATAVAITFLASAYIYKKQLSVFNFLKYTAIVLLACTIHKSAFIMIPMYFILQFNFKRSYKILYFIIAYSALLVILFLIFDRVFALGITTFFPEYSSSLVLGEAVWLGAGSIIAISRPIFILMFIYVNKRYINIKNKIDVVAINATLIFLLVNALSIRTHLLQRFSYYFIPLSIMIFPILISRMSKGDAQRWTIFLTITFFIFSIISCLIGGDLIFKYIWSS